jgi:hypothetical protein
MTLPAGFELVRDSDLCPARGDGLHWRGVVVARDDLVREWPPFDAPEQSPAATAAQNSVIGGIASERRVAKWLADAMRAEPANPVPKSEMRARAERDSSLSVSERAFERAWSEAVKTSQAVAWATPGRRKSPR